MKRVKCYGRAKVTTVDSSFKKNFFGSLDSSNSVGTNNFQEFRQRGSSSFTSGASASDYTNIHSRELFASDVDSCNLSMSTYSTCNSRNPRKYKSAKHTVASKTCQLDPFSFTSASHSSLDLQPVYTNKAKKTVKKYIRTSKSCAKKRTSKQLKTSAKVTASYSSHTDLKLSYSKGRSKNAKLLKSYKKGVLKRNRSTSRRRSLRTHSSIPLQPSCSEFCENPSSVINTGMKKPNKRGRGKKKQLNNKDQKPAVANFNRDMTSSFNSKPDSFWAAIQPNWSSIYEYSFKIEKASKTRKKTIPALIEQYRNKNAAFPDLIGEDNKLSSDERIFSAEIPVQSEVSSSYKHPLAVEPNVVRNDNFLKQGRNLIINSSETVNSKFKTTENISENVSVCKKSSAIACSDLANSQFLPEVKNVEILHRSEERASLVSNLCETVSEKLNINEIGAINTNENISTDKSIETCKGETKSKKGNKNIINAALTNLSDSFSVSENKNIFNRNNKNDGLSKNADQSQEYISAKPFKSKDFYSSTPLASPCTHATVAKKFSIQALSPLLHKGLFTTSTPAHSSRTVNSRQNQLCNVSRISRLGRQCSSLQDLSISSSVKLQRCQSVKINSSILSKRNKSHASFISGSSHNNENIHRTSRSCISFSRRGQLTLEESHSKNWSSIKEASAVAGTSSGGRSFKSPLTQLLQFCSQTRIIPFSELYNWSTTTVRKIGEGTYGEVFTLVQKKISSVIKVIPFSEENGDHSMQSVESVLSEVTVSKCLSELRNNKNYKTKNFNKLKSVHVVRGYYPNQMLVAWDKFSDAKTTYNSRPDEFNDQQIFAIIELEYGGKDMTCFSLRNAAEAVSVLKQIAISLAIAEEVHLFEHRDLHLGNILVQRNASKKISYVLGGKSYSIPNNGLIVTIIDFTLSRVLHDGCIFYNDLADDDSLFNQTGDYQFQIYKDTKELLNNEWHKCLLYSNVLWLTFLCVKLLDCDYLRPSSKIHEEGLKNIRTFQNNLRDCQNAFECLTACNILESVPGNIQLSAKKMAKKAKLVDRKSLQKSISRRTSNIA